MPQVRPPTDLQRADIIRRINRGDNLTSITKAFPNLSKELLLEMVENANLEPIAISHDFDISQIESVADFVRGVERPALMELYKRISSDFQRNRSVLKSKELRCLLAQLRETYTELPEVFEDYLTELAIVEDLPPQLPPATS